MAKLNLDVDPKRELDRKLMTAEQAAALVRSGDQLWIPSTHAPDRDPGCARDPRLRSSAA